MLRGNAIAKLDAKGRIKLPAAFRAAIESKYGNEFFVTSLRGESVRIYPLDVWTRIEQRVFKVSPFKPEIMKFKNWTNYYGQHTTMDAHGRLLIHPLVRNKAQLDGECAVLGQQNYLEVWNQTAFEAQLHDGPLSDDDLTVLAELGI